MPLNNLISKESVPSEANMFFELFLVDGKGNFIDVPVLIRNYRMADGKKPNVGMQVVDTWQLVRRFFIYDLMSGINKIGGYGTGSTPEYIRWAADVQLKIEMDMSQNEQIFRPYLIIDYSEKQTQFDATSTTPVQSSVDCFSDYTDTMNGIMIAFIFMNVLAFLVTLIKMYYFTLRNPRSSMEGDAIKMYAFKFIYHALDAWSEYMFWLMFFSCCSIFIAYKQQMNAYLLLPELGEASAQNYTAFKVILAMTLVAKLIAVLMKIVEQSYIDIYLIDWEKPNYETKQINGWRYMFIANEFAELQVNMRYVQPETCLIWFAFFWEGLGWSHLAETDPMKVYEDNTILKENLLLRFCMVGVLFFGIGGVMFILHNFDNRYNGAAINRFKDLCTLANISIIMLHEHAHGFYLHCKAPWGSSDIPLDWLQKELQDEAAGAGGQAGGRGLKSIARAGEYAV